jgi:hypothetical protein
MSEKPEQTLVEPPCGECGDPVEIPAPYHEDCVDWDMPDLDELDETVCVPLEELEDLVQKWRDIGIKHVDPRRTQELCANELQEVLDQHD